MRSPKSAPTPSLRLPRRPPRPARSCASRARFRASCPCASTWRAPTASAMSCASAPAAANKGGAIVDRYGSGAARGRLPGDRPARRGWRHLRRCPPRRGHRSEGPVLVARQHAHPAWSARRVARRRRAIPDLGPGARRARDPPRALNCLDTPCTHSAPSCFRRRCCSPPGARRRAWRGRRRSTLAAGPPALLRRPRLRARRGGLPAARRAESLRSESVVQPRLRARARGQDRGRASALKQSVSHGFGAPTTPSRTTTLPSLRSAPDFKAPSPPCAPCPRNRACPASRCRRCPGARGGQGAQRRAALPPVHQRACLGQGPGAPDAVAPPSGGSGDQVVLGRLAPDLIQHGWGADDLPASYSMGAGLAASSCAWSRASRMRSSSWRSIRTARCR